MEVSAFYLPKITKLPKCYYYIALFRVIGENLSRKASNKHRRPTLLIIVYSLIIGLCMALVVGFADVQEQRRLHQK